MSVNIIAASRRPPSDKQLSRYQYSLEDKNAYRVLTSTLSIARLADPVRSLSANSPDYEQQRYRSSSHGGCKTRSAELVGDRRGRQPPLRSLLSQWLQIAARLCFR